MSHAMDQKKYIHFRFKNWMMLLMLFCLAAGAPQAVNAATLDERYPGLAMGLLKSAVLTPLDNDTLLIADGVTIKRSQLLAGINNHEPKLRNQLEKNLIFVLE